MESGSGQTPEPPTPPERPSTPPTPPTPPQSSPPGQSSPPPQKPGSEPKLSERLRQPRVAAAIGIALAVVIILVLLLSGGDDEGGSSDSGAAAGEAREVSADELQDLASSLDHPVYWAGEQEGKTYELTETPEGNIFIRYLDPDVEIGSDEVASLTIGTYPVPDAYAAVQKTAKQKGALTGETPDGGIVVSNAASANSVYIAYPGTDIQIEVYDPNPKVAFETASSGSVEPIE